MASDKFGHITLPDSYSKRKKANLSEKTYDDDYDDDDDGDDDDYGLRSIEWGTRQTLILIHLEKKKLE